MIGWLRFALATRLDYKYTYYELTRSVTEGLFTGCH